MATVKPYKGIFPKIHPSVYIPWVRNSKKLEKPFDKEPLAGRGL
ncbi:hypothetical protein [Thermocrinis sp.]|jgi:hypothetical protein